MAQVKDYTGQLVGSKRILGRANEVCNKHPKWAWRCEQCGHEGSPTLDKTIPALGYVPGNIAVISWRANRLKNNGTLEELEALVEWMRKQKGASRS